MMNLPTSVTTFQVHSNFPTAAKLSNFSNFSETFQLQKKLSNFARFFPTSIGSFQLQSILSNFAWLFPTSAKLSNFSFFSTALFNYTYPILSLGIRHVEYESKYHSWLYVTSWPEFDLKCEK